MRTDAVQFEDSRSPTQLSTNVRQHSGQSLVLNDADIFAESLGSEVLARPGISDFIPSFVMSILFPSLWMFIGAVSSWDAYLVVKYRKYIRDLEENPIGNLLLDLDGGETSLFIGAKFLGTVLVLGVLMVVYQYSRRFGYVLTTAIAGFQLGLLCYIALA